MLTHNRLATDAQFAQPLACDSQTTVEYTLPVENLHAVIRRLAAAVPPGPGVVVAGDLLDLAMLSVTDLGRAVVLILHGDHDYYYDLAVKHDRVVHAYVAYSRRMFDRLLECLPHRAGSIHYIPYGIPLPSRVRRPAAGPLRLVFAGRLEHGQKGVLELPAIAAGLRDRSIDATWTIIGDGPDGAALRAAWPGSASVRYLGPLTNADTIEHVADHDVFVLPTRVEGLPIALLEAMGCGVVPVVSNIDSGVPDVVTADVDGLTAGGWRCCWLCRRHRPPRSRSPAARAHECRGTRSRRKTLRRAQPRGGLSGALRAATPSSTDRSRRMRGCSTAAASTAPGFRIPFVRMVRSSRRARSPMTAPLVSVLMTSYNRERVPCRGDRERSWTDVHGFRAAHRRRRLEDRTVAIASAYERLDSRIRVVINERNLGRLPQSQPCRRTGARVAA